MNKLVVRVPKEYTNKEIVRFAESYQPSNTINGWQVTEKVPCHPSDPDLIKPEDYVAVLLTS